MNTIQSFQSSHHCINFIYKYRECCKKCCKTNVIVIVRPSRTIVMCVDTFFSRRAEGHWISDKTFAFNFSVLLGKRPTKLITGKFSETRTNDRARGARETKLGARMLSPLHNRDRDFTTSKLRLSKYRMSGLSWLLDKLQNCRPFYRMCKYW